MRLMFLKVMKSAVAILTYRRLDSLKLILAQAINWCTGCPIAVFEDCGQTDRTEEFLVRGARFLCRDLVYEADVYVQTFVDRAGNKVDVEVYLSHTNSGVAANSNKAIRWFMEKADVDHLCLCNDDLEILGPFHEAYAAAHAKLEVGLFCFTDFAEETYKFMVVKNRGIQVKLMTRMTGIMMSMTRALVERIGYYDAYAFTFGQDHCDFNNRARLASFINLNGQPQHCLDIVTPYLRHQDVPSSLTDIEKHSYNVDADYMINIVGAQRLSMDPFVPYSTGRCSRVAGAKDGVGIPAQACHYLRLKEPRLEGALPIKFNVETDMEDKIPDVQDAMLINEGLG